MFPCQLLFKEEGAEPSRTLVVLLAGGGGRAFFDLGPGDQVFETNDLLFETEQS